MKKLDYKWLSPYIVEQVISHSTYQLNIPVFFGKFHPVFLVTLLHSFEGDPMAERQEHHPPPLSPIIHNGIEEYKTKLRQSLIVRYSMERLST